jgi:hypothetical protein
VVKTGRASLSTRAFPAIYASVVSSGYRWFKVHRYWFALRSTRAATFIARVFHDGAKIPGRLDTPTKRPKPP